MQYIVTDKIYEFIRDEVRRQGFNTETDKLARNPFAGTSKAAFEHSATQYNRVYEKMENLNSIEEEADTNKERPDYDN